MEEFKEQCLNTQKLQESLANAKVSAWQQCVYEVVLCE